MNSIRTKLVALKNEYFHSLYFKKVLHSFLLLSTMIFMIFLVTIFILMKKNYNNALSDIQERSITQAQSIHQTILKDIHNYALTLLDNSSIIPVLYGKDWDVTLALKLQEQYETLMNSSSLTSSAYFINYQTGTILDNYSRTSIHSHYDQDIIQLLSKMTPGRIPFICYPHTISYAHNGIFRSNTRLLSLIYYQNKNGALVINLDYDSYLELIQPTREKYIELIILNKNGQVIASSSEEDLFGMDYSENPIYQKIQTDNKRIGHFTHSLGDSSYDVSYQYNTDFGFCYISTLDKRFIYPESRILSFLTRYTFFCVLLCLVVSLAISYIIYKPIRYLKKQIADASGDMHLELSKEKDEFSFLLENYQTLTKKLKNVREHSLKERETKILKLLLTDKNSSAFLPNKLEELNTNFAYKNYRILLFNIDPFDTATEDASETAIFQYIVENVSQELLAKTYSVLQIDLVSANSVFLINYNVFDEVQLVQIIKEVQEFIHQHANFTFSVGIGTEVAELTELSLSYQSALYALSRRLLNGPECIRFASECMTEEPLNQPYPFELDTAIIQAIKATNLADFSELLEQFFNKIRSFSTDQIIYFIMQLNSSMQKLEYSLSIENVPSIEYRFLDRFYFSQLQEFVKERGIHDIAQITEIRNHQSGKKELIDTVMALIAENLYNPNLSVGFIADQVHLSVNYLRNIFKESVGESLSDYIKKEKLNLICKLLIDTDISLNEISNQLGFTTKNYFFTFFKKHLDMTPSEYRRIHQGKE